MQIDIFAVVANPKIRPLSEYKRNAGFAQACREYITSCGEDAGIMSADEILFFVKNRLTKRPRCPITNECCSFNRKHNKYTQFSPSINPNNHPEAKKIIQQKTETTNLDKFGKVHFTQTDQYAKAFKKTCLEKYGVENVAQDPDIREKIRQARLSEETQNKFKQTCLERYGYDHPVKSPDILAKVHKTTKLHLGTEFAARNKDIQEQLIQHNLEKYGVEHYYQSDDFKQKSIATNIEKYGVPYYSMSEDFLKTAQGWNIQQKTERYEKFKEYAHIATPNFTLAEYIADPTKEFEWINTATGNPFTARFWNFQQFPKGYQSSLEIIIREYLIQNNIPFVEGDRNILKELNQELDFYLPDYKLAIECNGIYWHSEIKGKDRRYHLNKTEECERQDIRLIHLWEDEILQKEAIVKSRLNSILGINQTHIYARKCEIKEVDFKTAKQFLEDNHLLGKDQANINLGLYYENVLVGVSTFNKTSTIGSSKYSHVLSRYCCLLNHRVVGGPSKLLKYFVKTYQPESLQTYAEVRFGEGKMYKTLGFDFSHRSQPSYFVIDPRTSKRYHRQRFMHKHLSKLLENYDPNLSEKQNCENHGYYRLYDCGKDVYILNNEQY